MNGAEYSDKVAISCKSQASVHTTIFMCHITDAAKNIIMNTSVVRLEKPIPEETMQISTRQKQKYPAVAKGMFTTLNASERILFWHSFAVI